MTDTKGQKHELQNLTYVEWNWRGGSIESYAPVKELSGQYSESNVKVPIENISRIVFEKVQDEKRGKDSNGCYYYDFFATVYLKTGESRRLLIKQVYGNGLNDPSFSFAGKSSFGEEIIHVWDIKEVVFGNSAGDQQKRSDPVGDKAVDH